MKTQLEENVEAGDNLDASDNKLENIHASYLENVREYYGYNALTLAELSQSAWKVWRDLETHLEGVKWDNGSGRSQAECMRAMEIIKDRIKFLEGNPNH